jgi:Holliday junction resolvase RusA-like endonuclease
MEGLRVTIPFLPPSSNTIYRTIPGRGRVLSSAAQQFQLKAMRIIQQEGRAALLCLKQNVPYALRLVIYFPEVENTGWYQFWEKDSRPGTKDTHKAGERKAATRYKRIDLSNRIKLLEDTVASAVGVDDSHTFHLSIYKEHDPKHPRVEVTLSLLPEEGGKEDAVRTRSESSKPHRAGGDLPKGRVPVYPSREQKGGSAGAPGRDALRRFFGSRRD